MLPRVVISRSIEKDLVKLLALITLLLAISAAFAFLWSFSIQPQTYNLVPSILLIWSSCIWLVARKHGLRLLVACGFVTILEFVAVVFLSSLFKDNSWDGNQYQSEGPLQIFLGWNPFHEFVSPPKWDTSWAVWLDTLPKFGWEISAFVLHLGGTQANSKILSFVGILILVKTAALLASTFELQRYQRYMLIIVSASFPIGVAQFPTSYQDGFSASWTIALITVIFSSQELLKRGNDVWPTVLFLSIGALLSKYSQAIPVFLILLVYFYFSTNLIKAIRRTLSILVGLVILGFNPYITNLMAFGNPLYPMNGANLFGKLGWGKQNSIENSINENLQENIYYSQTPGNLREDIQPLQFLQSIFSKTAHVTDKIPAELKFPGTFSKSEFEYFTNPDARVGGFGPFFSLALTLLLIGYLLKNVKSVRFSKFVLVGVTISAILTPYPWWARYVGFFYALIILLLLSIMVSGSQISKVFTVVVSLILSVQSVLLTYGHVQKELNYQKRIYEIDVPIESTSKISFRDQSFSGFRYDWSKSENFVYQNIEVDFFLNHIARNLKESEMKVMDSCYTMNGYESDWLPSSIKSSSTQDFFNTSGILSLKNTCNLNVLSEMQHNWWKIPFQKRSILD